MVHQAVKISQVVEGSLQLELLLIGLSTREWRDVIAGLEHIEYTAQANNICVK